MCDIFSTVKVNMVAHRKYFAIATDRKAGCWPHADDLERLRATSSSVEYPRLWTITVSSDNLAIFTNIVVIPNQISLIHQPTYIRPRSTTDDIKFSVKPNYFRFQQSHLISCVTSSRTLCWFKNRMIIMWANVSVAFYTVLLCAADGQILLLRTSAVRVRNVENVRTTNIADTLLLIWGE